MLLQADKKRKLVAVVAHGWIPQLSGARILRAYIVAARRTLAAGVEEASFLN